MESRTPSPDSDPLLNVKPWYENAVIQSILKISALIGAVTIILKLVGTITPIDYDVFIKDSSDIKLVLEGINFLILMGFCLYSIRVPVIKFKDPYDHNIINYNKLLGIEESDNLSQRAILNNERVNILIKQLNDNVIYYALTLMVVYLVFILLGLHLIPGKYNDLARSATDIFNFLSAIFLYLAFKVLYNNTLDRDNRRIIYYMDALFISFFYIILYALLFSKDKTVKNDLSLFSGIINGLAMSLLFSRFISMEHTFTEIFKNSIFKPLKKYRNYLYFGTIFILPLYAVIQPLFGDFELPEFGNSIIFANVVFLICFLGKLFFLSLFAIYIKNKLIHIYFHIVITKHGVPDDLISCFNFEEK